MGADASWRDVPKTCSLHIRISAFAVFGDEAGDPHLSTADRRLLYLTKFANGA